MTDPKHDEHSPDDFERITPVALRPGHPPPASGQRPARTNRPAVLAGAVLVALLVVAAAVFFWLGRPRAPTAAQSATAQAKPAPARTQSAPPPDADKLLAARQRAQTLRDRLAAKRKQLAGHGVARWAKAAYQDLGKRAGAGTRQFKNRGYAAAAKTYRQAIARADHLLAQIKPVLEHALARGARALADGKADAAAKAFALALAVAPGNAKAKAGAARAAGLDRVLALMHEGRKRENAGNLAAARAAYQKAHALDGAYAPAQAALSRVEASLAKRRFDHDMSSGLDALERHDYGPARAAFASARKIRPQASEAADGLARAKAGLTRQAIAADRDKARRAAAAGQWHAAASAYAKILKIDPTLAFAQKGRKRAAARAGLDDALSYHLAHLSRLADTAVRADVKTLLTKARAVDAPDARLRGQIARLSAHLATASQPVPVRLSSDGQTQVAVYRVGRLGAFQSKQLRLTPGTYTAVGYRQGYRDVRRQFTVAAGAPVGPITIVCQDKL